MKNKSVKERKSITQLLKEIGNKYLRLNLSHNTGTKIFSLVLAILFWFFVMDQVDPEITRVFENVPVNFINQQELEQSDLKIMNQHDYLVSVEIKGRRNDVLNLSVKNIRLWADMRSVRSGINNIYINRSINSDNVSIKEVYPNEIVLTVERVVTVNKPVKVMYNDHFQDNYFEIEQMVKPEEIAVVGPESLVNSVSHLGAYVNVGNFTSDVEKELVLTPYNSTGEVVTGVTLEKNSVTMSIKMGLKKEVPIVSNLTGTPKEGFEIVNSMLSPEKVMISGPVALIKPIEQIETEPIVLNGEEDAKITINANLTLPIGVESNLPNGIQLEVDVEPIVEKVLEFMPEEVEFRNLNPELELDKVTLDEPLKVSFNGIQSKMDLLEKSAFKPFIDFSEVQEPGIYKILIQVESSEPFTGALSIESVEFEITKKSEGGTE